MVSEAYRTYKFKETCAKGETLGALLDESHKSTNELYDASVLEVEQLIKICKASGAYGAKMIGEGWGGYVVSLIDSENVEKFVQCVEEV